MGERAGAFVEVGSLVEEYGVREGPPGDAGGPVLKENTVAEYYGTVYSFAESPVRALHGTADTLVPIDAARAAVRHLAQTGYQAELREFDGVQHSITPEMLRVLDGWLEAALAE